MVGMRVAAASVAAALVLAASPAAAQFFMKAKDLSGTTVRGDEPGVVVQAMPGATDKEVTAGLVWTMRAALNVAALQCQFEPTLLTVDNYNAMLKDHGAELKDSFDTLSKYFARTNKVPKAGQTALDQFGTKTYSSFSISSAQFNFCQTASAIGRDVIYAPRGGFATVAKQRMRELRNSLVPWGEQRFPRYVHTNPTVPRLDKACWSGKGEWQAKKCGPLNFGPPLAAVNVAQR